MARRVYVHIGVMKSATSYVQALCELNRDRLAEAGILWCPDEVRYQAIRDLLGKGPDARRAANAWSVVAEDLHRHPGDAVFSNELLGALNVHQVRRVVGALPAGEVHVVITARDLARVIPSHWQTTIKNGKTWTWSEFASSVCVGEASSDQAAPDGSRSADANEEEDEVRIGTHTWFWRRHDVPSIVARWATVLPAGQITLVTVPRETSELETVAARFGSVAGVDLVGLDQPDRRNPSLGAHSAELLRRLNRSMAETEFRDPDHRFGRALGAALSAEAHLEPRFALTQADQDWVGTRALAMIDEIKRSGIGVEGDLADLIPAPSPPADSVDPGDTTDSELLSAGTRGLLGLASVFHDLRGEGRELRLQLSASEAKSAALEDRVRQQHKRIRRLQAERADSSAPASIPSRLRSRLRRNAVARWVVERWRQAR